MINNFKISEEQKEIINFPESCFVEAMAGSGKTTTLVQKINKIINLNNNWKKIAYITFARKAAAEGKDKLKHLSFGNFIGTYDSFLMQEIIPFVKHKIKKDILFEWSNKTLKTFKEGLNIFKTTGKIYSYINEKTKKGDNFLSDLALLILIKNKNAKNYLISKYSHIFNDEAQDYNNSQIKLIKFIFCNLKIPMTFVGDFNQSIYDFRGSNPHGVKSFLEEIGIKKFKLSFNYRCHYSIQDYSLHFLGDNSILFPKNNNIFFKEALNEDIEKIINSIEEKHNSLVILRYSITKMENLLPHFAGIKPLDYESDLDFPEWCSDLIKNILISKSNEYDFLYGFSEINIKNVKKQFSIIKNNFRINKDKTIAAINILSLELMNSQDNKLSERIFNSLNDKEVERNINQELILKKIGTIHSSKGLEYDNVLIFTSDFTQNLFDFSNEVIKEYNVTKNMHYVSCTRAKHNLFIIDDASNLNYKSRYFKNYEKWKNKI